MCCIKSNKTSTKSKNSPKTKYIPLFNVAFSTCEEVIYNSYFMSLQHQNIYQMTTDESSTTSNLKIKTVSVY